MAGKPKYTDDQVADALTACKGMPFVASRRLGCDHKTMTARIARSERLRAIVAEQSGLLLDIAELKLYEAIEQGAMWAIVYYLSRQGKDRGYTTRRERHQAGAADGPVVLRVFVADDRQVTQELEALERRQP